MASDKVLSLIGIATKAGKVSSGEFSTEKSIKSGKAFLVIIADDASANTKKKFTNMCRFYKVPICTYGTKEILGNRLNKAQRASLAIQDAGLGATVLKHVNQV